MATAVSAPTLRVEEVSDRTVVGLFLRQAERLESRALLHRYDESAAGWLPITWREVRERVLRTASMLIRAGAAPGDSVLLLGPNSPEWIVCDLAIQATGAVSVPVYPTLPAASALFIAADSKAALAIAADEAQAAKVAPVCHVLRFDSELAQCLAGTGDPIASELVERLRGLGPDDVATIAYTSGTSGRPKGAVITQASVVEIVRSMGRAYDIRPDDVILSFLPYSHILERIAGLYFGGLYAGAELKLGRGFDSLVADVREVRPTCMEGVPRLFEKMVQGVTAELAHRSAVERALFRAAFALARPRAEGRPLSRLQRLRVAAADRIALRSLRAQLSGGRLRFFVSGSAPLLPSVEAFFWALGLPILQGWGMTELTCAATCNTEANHRLGTVGLPLAGVSLRLANDGEILVRGPGVMREYQNNPGATRESFEDGWFKTGDIGLIDRDGYLTITDRKKDLIKTSGGKYVAPMPLETRLQQDPWVETAVVTGDARPYVTALIALDWDRVRADLRADDPPERLAGDGRVMARLQTAIDGVNRDLASFETVKYFRLLPRPLELERDEITPSLKVKRRIVEEHFRELIDAMYEGKLLSPAGLPWAGKADRDQPG